MDHTRRDFLKRTGLAAIGMSAAGNLSNCQPKQKKRPKGRNKKPITYKRSTLLPFTPKFCKAKFSKPF